MSNLTIVIYHYVRKIKNSNYPKIKGLEIAGFKRQLDYLEKLGYEGSTPATRGEASNLIGKLKAMRGDKSTDTISLEIYGDKWSEKNPFEKIHEHTPDYQTAKLWRESLDN